MLCYSIFIVYLLLFILIYKLTNLLDKTYTWNLCGPVPLWGTLASSVVLVVLGGVPTVVLEAGSPEIPARSKRGTRPLQKCQNGGFMLVSWWVVDLPLWKMMELVSWDDDIPNIWGKKSCSKTTNQFLLVWPFMVSTCFKCIGTKQGIRNIYVHLISRSLGRSSSCSDNR